MIQYGIFSDDDDLLMMRSGNRWVRIPKWVSAASERGGLRRIMEYYGLERYTHNWQENAALRNLEDEARAIMRFYRRGGDRHYFNILGDLHRRVLWEEQRIRLEYRHLHGDAFYEALANRLGYDYYPLAAKALLEEARDMLVIDYRRREMRTLKHLIKMLYGDEPLEQVA